MNNENQSSPKHLEVNDFKSLVQNRGQMKKGEKSFELKSPRHDNEDLQRVAKSPDCKVKPLGDAPKKGETCTYELSGSKDAKSVRVTVSCK